MKFSSFKYFTYSLQFINQFGTSSGKLRSRKIFLIELKDDKGNQYYGEASPLPEFNSETFEDVEIELQNFSHKNEFECGTSLKDIFDNIDSLEPLPSVQYALEHIFITASLKSGLKVLPHIAADKSVNVNAVIDRKDFQSAKNDLEKIIAKGYNVVKIKTDDNHFEEIYELMNWAVGELKAEIKFRIDPNGSWCKKDTLLRSERLSKLPVEYIEQPVKSSVELMEIANYSPIPIAADESIRNLEDAEKLIRNSKIKFLVVKPMLFGGLTNIMKLKKIIEQKDVKIIISSVFESNVGRRHLVLASALVNNKLAHGLGTAELFSNQPAEDIFPVEKGVINFTIDNYLSELKINI